jgi:ABC-type Mn2+/Zn2+ transport system permease subunit
MLYSAAMSTSNCAGVWNCEVLACILVPKNMIICLSSRRPSKVAGVHQRFQYTSTSNFIQKTCVLCFIIIGMLLISAILVCTSERAGTWARAGVHGAHAYQQSCWRVNL